MKATTIRLSLALAMLCASSASAAIILGTGNTPFAGQENILLNSGGTGTTVTGTGNSSGIPFDFDSAGEVLSAPSSGAARVEALDGAFTALRMIPQGANVSFATLVFNLNVAGNGSVQITVVPTAGANVVQSFSVGNGQNFFNLSGDAGERFRSVSLLLTGATGEDVRQIRISGLGEVPEPATYLLTGAGLAVFGLLRRKR